MQAGNVSSHFMRLFLHVPQPKWEFLCFLLEFFFFMLASSMSTLDSSFLILGGKGFFKAELNTSICFAVACVPCSCQAAGLALWCRLGCFACVLFPIVV